MSDPKKKNFKLNASQIKPLAEGHGGCIATDQIVVDGKRVGYMVREKTIRKEDSGWCFMSGSESQDYMDDSKNHGIYDVNTIANYDLEIIPFLNAPPESCFIRDTDTGRFEEIPYESPQE